MDAEGNSKVTIDMRRLQTTKFLKERVIANDERDAQVWALITDVPKMKAPWHYICFVLNVIIPGKRAPS